MIGLKVSHYRILEKLGSAQNLQARLSNSGMMKVFLDRLGFSMHRPRFFGKAFTSIIAQGKTVRGYLSTLQAQSTAAMPQ